MLKTVSIAGFTSYPGIRWRLKDPTTELILEISGSPEAGALERYAAWFECRFAGCFRLFEGRFPADWLANPEADGLAVHLAAGITALQRLAMQPVRRAQVLEASPGRLHLALPSFNGTVLQGAIRLAIQLLLELDADPSGRGERLTTLLREIDDWLPQAMDASRCGEEQGRFALAAARLGIPLVATVTGCLEIGHGCGRRVLSHSLLSTPSPAASLASDKLATYLVLHRAGIPVPETRIVNDEADLEQAAASLGWPLVVKPLDQSLQRGVTTNVADSISLAAAYRVARNVSQSSVLLQQQVEGIEFRLLVLGTSQVVARRSAFGDLVGDGQSSVEALARASIANLQEASDRAHAAEGLPDLRGTVEKILAEKKLSIEAIPDVGQQIRLSHAMVRWLGGLQTDYSDLLHPSYGQLARRVARVLHLDVAGLDLITPDPRRPWWEVHAAVLEANSRPFIFAHEHANPSLRIYEQALRHGLRDAKPPLLVAAAGGELLAACWPPLEVALTAVLPDGTALGVLRDGACSLGGDPLHMAGEVRGQVGQALLADPLCGAALLAWTAAELVRYGRPCEAIDLAILSAQAEPLVLHEMLDANPEAVIWLGPGAEPGPEALAEWRARWPERPLVELLDPSGLAAVLPELLSASTHSRRIGHAVRLHAP